MGKVEKLGYAMIEVRYPNLRNEVLEAVRALSDFEYQQRVWVRRDVLSGNYDEFTHRVRILYDDTQVLEAPQAAIGDVLASEEEACAMQELVDVLNSIFDRFGTELSDDKYLELPEWGTVVAAARRVLVVLEGS
ncbi:SCO4402 family protein [Lentzea sp. NPDC004789]